MRTLHVHTDERRQAQRRHASLLLSCVLAFGLSATRSAPAYQLSIIEQHFNKFYLFQALLSRRLTPRDAANSINREYTVEIERFQALPNLKLTSTSDLRLLYRAAMMAASYAYNVDRVAEMEIDFGELASRQRATRLDVDRMYSELIQYRMFNAARELARRTEDHHLDPPPQFFDVSNGVTPTKLVLSGNLKTITREPLNLDLPAEIIVVASPSCHFCQNAANEIDRDPQLRRTIKEHSVWLALPDVGLQFEGIDRWNKDHPNEVMAMAFRLSEWPMFADLGTPTFYFFERRKVVTIMRGWPPLGGNARLRAAMRRARLL